MSSKLYMRNIFGGGLKPSDPRRFLIEAMVGAMEADGAVSEIEKRALVRNLEEHDLFAGLAGAPAEMLVQTASEAMRLAGKPGRRVGAIARGLPARTFRLTAYAMACEVCAADRDVHPLEAAYLEDLRNALLLTEEEGREILSGVRQHNGIRALEIATAQLVALAPRCIEAMMLAATAAGVGQNERRALVSAVTQILLDLSVLPQGDVQTHVDRSFERFRGRAVLEEFAALSGAFVTPNDRLWCTVYMMAVAIAAGNSEWQEVGFFTIVGQRFGMTSGDLDHAWQIARSLPPARRD